MPSTCRRMRMLCPSLPSTRTMVSFLDQCISALLPNWRDSLRGWKKLFVLAVLDRRLHPERRMGREGVVVRQPAGDLVQHDGRAREIRTGQVVPTERVHEGFTHP